MGKAPFAEQDRDRAWGAERQPGHAHALDTGKA